MDLQQSTIYSKSTLPTKQTRLLSKQKVLSFTNLIKLIFVRNNKYIITIKRSRRTVVIDSREISYVKAAGNYLEIHHGSGRVVIRMTIGKFRDLVPDPKNYTRIHRSYIVRNNKVMEKNKRYVVVSGVNLPIGSLFVKELERLL